jgi:hypothetical protein
MIDTESILLSVLRRECGKSLFASLNKTFRSFGRGYRTTEGRHHLAMNSQATSGVAVDGDGRRDLPAEFHPVPSRPSFQRRSLAFTPAFRQETPL